MSLRHTKKVIIGWLWSNLSMGVSFSYLAWFLFSDNTLGGKTRYIYRFSHLAAFFNFSSLASSRVSEWCVCECEPRVLLRGMAKNVIISFFTLFFSVDHNYDYYFLWFCECVCKVYRKSGHIRVTLGLSISQWICTIINTVIRLGWQSLDFFYSRAVHTVVYKFSLVSFIVQSIRVAGR